MDSGGGRARLVGGGETVREQGEPGKSWGGGDQREQSDRQDGGGHPSRLPGGHAGGAASRTPAWVGFPRGPTRQVKSHRDPEFQAVLASGACDWPRLCPGPAASVFLRHLVRSVISQSSSTFKR